MRGRSLLLTASGNRCTLRAATGSPHHGGLFISCFVNRVTGQACSCPVPESVSAVAHSRPSSCRLHVFHEETRSVSTNCSSPCVRASEPARLRQKEKTQELRNCLRTSERIGMAMYLPELSGRCFLRAINSNAELRDGDSLKKGYWNVFVI